MILPQTYTLTLIVMIFGMLCLGSWANTFKLGGNWRFELYYFDFAFGVLLAAILLTFTVGSMGFDGFSVLDDVGLSGKRQWFYAFLAGIIFNLGNMLLLSAVSVAGMAVAFPIGIGTAVVIGALLNLVLQRSGNSVLLLAGCVLILAAMVVDGLAGSALRVLRHEALAKAGKAKSTRRPSLVKGIVLSVVAGLLMASFAPLVQGALATDWGLGPYSVMAIFAVGVFFSTFVFNMFFVNLAVEGAPVDIGDYFKAHPKLHLLGFSGGVLWTVGATATLVASVAPQQARLDPGLGYGLNQGFAVIAALWGLLAWKEFRGSGGKIKGMAALMLVLFVGGLVLLSLATWYVRKG